MRIFMTSDLHGRIEPFAAAVRRESPDVVVVAGDTINMGAISGNRRRVWEEVAALCRELPNTQFVVVPGNHEEDLVTVLERRGRGLGAWGALVRNVVRGLGALQTASTNPLPNLANFHWLSCGRVEIGGLVFFGAERYETTMDLAGVQVLVTHFPANVEPRRGDLLGIIHGHEHTANGNVRWNQGRFTVNASSRVARGEPYVYHVVEIERVGASWRVDPASWARR